MALETTEKDISIAFEKLAITSKDGDHCKTPTTIFSYFKSKILAAIDDIRQKKRRPDIDAIYEHIMKSEASNADKDPIQTIMPWTKLLLQELDSQTVDKLHHNRTFF